MQLENKLKEAQKDYESLVERFREHEIESKIYESKLTEGIESIRVKLEEISKTEEGRELLEELDIDTTLLTDKDYVKDKLGEVESKLDSLLTEWRGLMIGG